jgi:hypothetical protein
MAKFKIGDIVKCNWYPKIEFRIIRIGTGTMKKYYHIKEYTKNEYPIEKCVRENDLKLISSEENYKEEDIDWYADKRDVVERFKAFEAKFNDMEVNEIIDLIHVLNNMSQMIETFRSVRPKSVSKKVLNFLKHNEGKLDPRLADQIKYIAQVWVDVFEKNEIILGLKRRIDPILEKLKKLG